MGFGEVPGGPTERTRHKHNQGGIDPRNTWHPRTADDHESLDALSAWLDRQRSVFENVFLVVMPDGDVRIAINQRH